MKIDNKFNIPVTIIESMPLNNKELVQVQTYLNLYSVVLLRNNEEITFKEFHNLQDALIYALEYLE